MRAMGPGHAALPRRGAIALCLLGAASLVGCGAGDSSIAGTGAQGGRQPTHIDGLGSLSFPNTGAADAQEPFLRGMLLLHSFEYESAAATFREAQDSDSNFALAYWGEAMTHNHPLWRQKDREEAHNALSRLAETAQERRTKAETEREAMYLDAAEALFAEGSKTDTDFAYMDTLRRLHEAYPDDLEARALYALSMLGSTDGERDFATYVRAAATAQPVFEANPNHPGAAHYIIHSFDDPVHAPLGLEAALAYAEIAPNAAHAQHMTTHIFVALGMWDEVVSGNIRARDSQDADFADRERPPNVCGHYSSWLQYGHLQRGEVDKAAALMDLCHHRMSEEPTGGERSYFVSMRARQIVDSESWQQAGQWAATHPDQADGESDDRGSSERTRLRYQITDAFAHSRAGNVEPARHIVESFADDDDPSSKIELQQLRGLIALADGNESGGIALLNAAAAAEDSMAFDFGPPRLVKPTFELLGEELLRLGRREEAEAALRRAVERTPGRLLAVRGLDAASATES